ncbi:MAG: GFA family protein [Rhodobacteraceae bacterium]|nr:GFA family protein [Paracoccaceae bacterium]
MKVSCHCGAVELDIDLAKSDPIEDARRCDCSFCARRQAANITVPQDALSVVKGADHLSMYQWGTNRAEHYFCEICGIYTHHRRYSDTSVFGVNVGCIEGINTRDLEPLSYVDGRSYSKAP